MFPSRFHILHSCIVALALIVLVYVYANQITTRHPQINYKLKSGNRAKLKISSIQLQLIEGANGHPNLDLVGTRGCDSTPQQKPNAELAASL